MADNDDATQAQVDAAVTALATATSTFNNAKKAGTKPVVGGWVRANSPEAGKTYLVVGKLGEEYYALTTDTMTFDSKSHPKGAVVTVSGNRVTTSVEDKMKWDFASGSSNDYYTVTNDGKYLTRGSSAAINYTIVTAKGKADYVDFKYSSPDFYNWSASVSKEFYMYVAQSGNNYYFGNTNEDSEKPTRSEIYLFEYQAGEQREIQSVDDLADINVAYGTAQGSIGLPSQVQVTLDDSSTQNIDVVWNDGTPTYNANAAGTYRFDGTLTLPAGILNTGNHKAQVNVIVSPAPAIQYASTAPANFDQTVAYGTSETAALAALAGSVGVTGTEGEAGTATIAWSVAGYNGNVAGTYNATGVLTLPDGWEGSPAPVTAAITVDPQPTEYGHIKGMVQLKVASGNYSGVTVKAIEGATEYTATTSADGEFLLSNIPVGSYTVTFSKDTYLPEQRSAQVTVGQTHDLGLIVMKGGDANGDGKVDLLDLTELASAYDSVLGGSNYNPDCDFNGDGKIDLLDLTILATNYNEGNAD